MNPAPSESASTRAWEQAYVRFESPEEEVRKFIGRLRTLGADAWPRDAAILELFCGRGSGLVALDRLGFTRLRGVDLSPRLVDLYRGNAHRIVGDCRRLPLLSASQDVAIVQGGLHHLPRLPDDLERVLDEVMRVLKPGSVFVVVEPWLTPFLELVHRVGCSRLGRRLWDKMDSLATMIEHESATYERWLAEPALVSEALHARFVPTIDRRSWGKLFFVGHPRTL